MDRWMLQEGFTAGKYNEANPDGKTPLTVATARNLLEVSVLYILLLLSILL
jgi:hypothetical protein